MEGSLRPPPSKADFVSSTMMANVAARKPFNIASKVRLLF